MHLQRLAIIGQGHLAPANPAIGLRRIAAYRPRLGCDDLSAIMALT